MNWELTNCQKGDMIRVKLGGIYHYGIYVSDEEVIQFGYPPVLREKDKDNVVVVSTDIETFSCHQMVEVASLSFFDKKKRFKPDVTVELARKRLGEGGYNIIHNNCEHFAYECYTGVRYSSQEADARKKWTTTPFVNVYVSHVPSEYATSESWTRKILFKALEKDFRLKEDELPKNIKKTSNTKYNFDVASLGDFIAIALSNKKVAITVGDKAKKHSFKLEDRYFISIKSDIVDQVKFYDASEEKVRIYSKGVEEIK